MTHNQSWMLSSQQVSFEHALCSVKNILQHCHLSLCGGKSTQSGNDLYSSIVFFSLGFVLLGYSSQLHHVTCFTWPRARPHCVAGCLFVRVSSYLCPFGFDLIFSAIFSCSVLFKTLFPHIFFFSTRRKKMHSVSPSLSIKPAATLQPKHCLTCLAWTLSMK